MTELEYIICEAEQCGEISPSTKEKLLLVLEKSITGYPDVRQVAAGCVALASLGVMIIAKVKSEARITKTINDTEELSIIQKRINELSRQIANNQFKMDKLMNLYAIEKLKADEIGKNYSRSRNREGAKVYKQRSALLKSTITELAGIQRELKADVRELCSCTSKLRKYVKRNGDEAMLKKLDEKISEIEANVKYIDITELQRQRKEDFEI